MLLVSRLASTSRASARGTPWMGRSRTRVRHAPCARPASTCPGRARGSSWVLQITFASRAQHAPSTRMSLRVGTSSREQSTPHTASCHRLRMPTCACSVERVQWARTYRSAATEPSSRTTTSAPRASERARRASTCTPTAAEQPTTLTATTAGLLAVSLFFLCVCVCV